MQNLLNKTLKCCSKKFTGLYKKFNKETRNHRSHRYQKVT